MEWVREGRKIKGIASSWIENRVHISLCMWSHVRTLWKSSVHTVHAAKSVIKVCHKMLEITNSSWIKTCLRVHATSEAWWMATERNNSQNLTEGFLDVQWKLITIKLLHITASADQNHEPCCFNYCI